MADIGYGVKFFHGDSDPAATEVTEVQDITPPALKGAKVQVKAHNLTNNRVVNLLNPLSEWEDCKVSFVYSAAKYSTLSGLMGATKYFKIEYSDGASETFEGFIVDLAKSAPLEKEMTIEATIAVASDVEFDDGVA